MSTPSNRQSIHTATSTLGNAQHINVQSVISQSKDDIIHSLTTIYKDELSKLSDDELLKKFNITRDPVYKLEQELFNQMQTDLKKYAKQTYYTYTPPTIIQEIRNELKITTRTTNPANNTSNTSRTKKFKLFQTQHTKRFAKPNLIGNEELCKLSREILDTENMGLANILEKAIIKFEMYKVYIEKIKTTTNTSNKKTSEQRYDEIIKECKNAIQIIKPNLFDMFKIYENINTKPEDTVERARLNKIATRCLKVAKRAAIQIKHITQCPHDPYTPF
jgi:hypothetical protein